jgi:histidinol phosphatase-like enzyme
MPPTIKHVILDRDGVLNVERGDGGYISDWLQVALTGMDGGELAPLSDITIRAPSQVVARIQEVHDVCIHAIAEVLQENVRRAIP